MVGKSTHLQVIPLQSTQNTANLPLQTCEKNQWIFFVVQNYIISFISHNNFASLGSFAKVSVFVQPINPWMSRDRKSITDMCLL